MGSASRTRSWGGDIRTLQETRGPLIHRVPAGAPARVLRDRGHGPAWSEATLGPAGAGHTVGKTRFPSRSLQLGGPQEGGGGHTPSLRGQAAQPGQPPGARCPWGSQPLFPAPLPPASARTGRGQEEEGTDASPSSSRSLPITTSFSKMVSGVPSNPLSAQNPGPPLRLPQQAWPPPPASSLHPPKASKWSHSGAAAPALLLFI